MSRRIMIPVFRLDLIDTALARLVDEVKKLHTDSIVVEHHPMDQSDEAKRKRAVDRQRKSRKRKESGAAEKAT